MSIKLTRARRLSDTGRYPGTYDALLDHMPCDLIARLTAAEIAVVIDTMYRCSARAKALAERDAITEGCVWDARHRKLVELAR